MTELRNVEADLSRFRLRMLVASIVVVLAFPAAASRLVYLQVVRHDDLDAQAEATARPSCPSCPTAG
jgi:penicillin-binding protein 2